MVRRIFHCTLFANGRRFAPETLNCPRPSSMTNTSQEFNRMPCVYHHPFELTLIVFEIQDDVISAILHVVYAL
jgi:hypothetical protein